MSRSFSLKQIARYQDPEMFIRTGGMRSGWNTPAIRKAMAIKAEVEKNKQVDEKLRQILMTGTGIIRKGE